MTKNYPYLLLLCFTLIYTPAHADEIDTDRDSVRLSYKVDEVVIQTFKSNDKLSTQPISASVLSAQVIRDRNISGLKDVSGFIPNFFAPEYGSKMTSPVYVRGIGSRINAPSVGLYVDGIPYFDRSAFDINLNDIERIEILRGPQGTIYGRNTMGGIVNIYTKSPFRYQETNIELGAGSYNNYSAGASHYNKIGNSFGYALSANVQHGGGYFTNDYTGKKADGITSTAERIRLSWRARHNLYFHLTSAYEYSDQDGYPYGLYNKQTNKVDKIDYNRKSLFRRNMSTTGLNTDYSTENFRLSGQTSFQYFDGHQGLDQDFTPADLYYVNFRQRQRMYSQEVNIKSVEKDNRHYNWLFGAFGFYQDYETSNNIDYIQTKTIDLQDINSPTRGVALFHQSAFDNIFIDGLSATVGLRFDWEEGKAHTLLTTFTQNADPKVTRDRRDKAVYRQLTPKASLAYTFGSGELVYATVTRGYKAGGFNNTAQLENDLTYEPEHSWNYEIGTKASCFDNLIYTDFSMFYIDWDNQQVAQYQPDGRGFVQRNAGRSSSKGVELTMHVNPLERLSFQLNYGYTLARFERYRSNETTDYAGKLLPMIPRNTFSVAADYTVRFNNRSLLDRITFNAQYSGLGSIYWREDNLDRQKFYSLVNAKVTAAKNNMSVELWTKNITNSKYVTYFFTSMGGQYAQMGRPFTCGVNVNLKF